MIFTDEEYVSLTLRECFSQRSGEEGLRLACEYESTCLKLGRYKNHSIFNMRCKKTGLVSKAHRVWLDLECGVTGANAELRMRV